MYSYFCEIQGTNFCVNYSLNAYSIILAYLMVLSLYG